jgi:hypothetical protein
MKVENARWQESKYKPHFRKPESESVKALKAMAIGDVKRIHHDDVSCRKQGCTLVMTISRLKRNGMMYKQYHENTGIMVVKRLR